MSTRETAGEWDSMFGPTGATFTRDGTCRTLLWRTFANPERAVKPLLGVIGKNPSKADATKNDATVRLLYRIALDDGAGGFLLGNLVPYVATDPQDMIRLVRAKSGSEVLLGDWTKLHAENEVEIDRIRRWCHRILVAWGNLEPEIRGLGSTALLKLSRPNWHGEVVTLGRNKDGSPRHPLRTKIVPLVPFMSSTLVCVGCGLALCSTSCGARSYVTRKDFTAIRCGEKPWPGRSA